MSSLPFVHTVYLQRRSIVSKTIESSQAAVHEAHHRRPWTMTGEDAASLHDADSRLAQLSIAEQACSPARPAAENGHANGQLQQNGGPYTGPAAAQSTPEPGIGEARRPPLHLVNARRRPSQGGGGRNIVNVYTRDGEKAPVRARFRRRRGAVPGVASHEQQGWQDGLRSVGYGMIPTRPVMGLCCCNNSHTEHNIDDIALPLLQANGSPSRGSCCATASRSQRWCGPRTRLRSTSPSTSTRTSSTGGSTRRGFCRCACCAHARYSVLTHGC